MSHSSSLPLVRRAHIGYVSGVFSSVDNHELRVSHGLGRILSEISLRCDRLTVALSSSNADSTMLTHRIPLTSGNVRAIPLPEIPNIARGLLFDRQCRHVVRRLEEQCDVIIVHMPFSPPTALLPVRGPRLYHVCGDCVEVVRASHYYRGLKRLAAMSAAYGIDWLQRSLFRNRRVRVITNGQEMYEQYGRPLGRPVVSSSLLVKEVASVSRQRPREDAFRILFVGYLRPEKGVETLLDSFIIARKRIPSCELHIIGSQDLSEGGAAASLLSRVARLHDEGIIHLHGHVPFGKDLFQHYADADVLVLPSRSEGTPRVLVEARAFGCPIIASRVGGIPTSVRDRIDGLLVPPNSPDAIANAIIEIAENRHLRDSLIQAGIEYATERTLEHYVDDILGEVEILLNDGRK
jgi:glycosyltransferase involved in cell wall biosynthesis